MLAHSIFSSQQHKSRKVYSYCIRGSRFSQSPSQFSQSMEKYDWVELWNTQPLGKFLSFLEATIAFEGMGRPRGFRRFRKTHLENILPRGSRDRDPRYPKGVPWDQKFFWKNFLLKSYLGICRQVWGLLWVKSDF